MIFASTARQTRLEHLWQDYRSAFRRWIFVEKARESTLDSERRLKPGGEDAQALAQEAASVYAAARNALTDEMLSLSNVAFLAVTPNNCV